MENTQELNDFNLDIGWFILGGFRFHTWDFKAHSYKMFVPSMMVTLLLQTAP